MQVQPVALADEAEIESIDNRFIAMMRLLLALSALLIVIIDPTSPNRLIDRFVVVTYVALGLYVAYSAALYLAARRDSALQRWLGRHEYWADVAWYTLFIALSSGTSSIFFFFYFFAILAASFVRGYRTGMCVVIVSAALFTVVGFFTAPAGPGFELNRFLLRPIYLFALGYMMAYWGGFEIALKRRLALLKEVSRLANPRFGVDRTTGRLLERLRRFYDADACMLVEAGPTGGDYTMRRADRYDPERAAHSQQLPEPLGRQFLAPPESHALIYNRRPRWWQPLARSYAYDTATRAPVAGPRELNGRLATALDAVSFVSVPFAQQNGPTGRLYVTATNGSDFDATDADFLLQVIGHVAPLVANVRLVDRLASDAAEVERQRIAHDLHDSVIQPYIGLQMGLAAMSRKLEAGEPNIAADIKRLDEQISHVIADLRGYMRGLKTLGGPDDALLPSVRRFAETFTETTGIAVQIHAKGDLRLNDRLAAEVFQMIAEGLSNIRRHSRAMQACVELARRNNDLVLRIEDQGANGAGAAPFTPRSISERAAALGGSVRVERRGDGGSAVVVEIPL